jgi:hypothetical protein
MEMEAGAGIPTNLMKTHKKYQRQQDYHRGLIEKL